MTSLNYKSRYSKESTYVTKMCQKYGMLKRTVNFIRYDIKGRIKSYMELKKTELRQWDTKISVKEMKVQKLLDVINTYKPLVTDNIATEKQQNISQIVNLASKKGKSIVIEDLSFKKKKAKTDQHDKNKQYNKMIHAFDYSRYKNTMENACHRNKVELIKVNPYRTSQIGKQKYCNKKKLNVHQAASYVIARKGQGVMDTYNKKVG